MDAKLRPTYLDISLDPILLFYGEDPKTDNVIFIIYHSYREIPCWSIHTLLPFKSYIPVLLRDCITEVIYHNSEKQ